MLLTRIHSARMTARDRLEEHRGLGGMAIPQLSTASGLVGHPQQLSWGASLGFAQPGTTDEGCRRRADEGLQATAP